MNETAQVFGKRIGLIQKQGNRTNTAIGWDALLDLAVHAYWRNRSKHTGTT